MKKSLLFAFFALFVNVSAIAGDIKRPESYNYQRGCEAINKGELEDGLRYLQLELQDNPKNGYAWAWILSVHMNKKEYGEAVDAGLTALKLLPKKDSYYIGFVHKSLSRVYYHMDDKDMALTEISLAIKADPEEMDYLAMRADLYYYEKAYDKANADFQKIISVNPGQTTGYMGIGRNLLAQKSYNAAIEKFSYAMKLDEDFSQPYAFRAECYIGKGDYLLAAQDLVKAIDMDGNDKAFSMIMECNDSCYQNIIVLMEIKSTKDSKETDWDYYLGVAHQQHNHYQEAISCYMRSLENESHSVTCENIAECYGELGNYQRAHKYIDMAIAMDSTRSDLFREKADYFYYSGEYNKAIDMISRYISLNPEGCFGYYRRGFYKDNINDIDGAIKDYTFCITLEPRYTYAFLGRGDMYMQKGNIEAAYKDYRMVVDKDTTILKQGNCRQYAYQMLGMRDSAEVYMQQILDKYPTEGNYYDAACLMSRMGEYKRSIEYLKIAFEKGYHEINHLEIDDDLNGIRDMEEYKDLVRKYRLILKENNKVEGDEEICDVELETTEIPFNKSGDMMMIECKINNLPLHFIFDTGASDASISDVEANFMMKNGYLNRNDIVGKARYQTADGNISEGTVINLKHVNFGGLELTDVKASVVKSQKAPLLLGQSVFGRLGRIEIDNKEKVVKVTHKKK